MNLQELFERIPDARRKQGRRFKLTDVLWFTFLAIASGYQGYRGIHKFAQANRDFLIDTFGLTHGMLSHVTIRQLLMNIDQEAFIHALHQWIDQHALLAGSWVSADGKVLGSTLKNTFTKDQDFTATVSLLCQQSGLTLRLAEYTNKTGNEQESLRLLLPSLQGKGLILTMDAFHTQKKQ